MTTKFFRTFLIIGSIICTLILWLTRPEWQNSLSAFASSQNAVWYNLMHVMGISFWLLNSAAKNRAGTDSPFPLFWKKKVKVWTSQGKFKLYNLVRPKVMINHGHIDILTGLLMGGILVTNMYLAYAWHVAFTIACFATALFNIVFTAPKRELIFRWIAVFVGASAFVGGYVTEMHFLIGEVLGMTAIAFGMIRQIWKYD